VSKRKKMSVASPPIEAETAGPESVTTSAVEPEVVPQAAAVEAPPEAAVEIAGAAQEDVVENAPESDAPESDWPDSGAPESDATDSDVPETDAAAAESETARRVKTVARLLADANEFDSEMTVNLVGDLPLPGRDDLDEPTVAASGEALTELDSVMMQRKHLRGLIEALVFASDSPIKPKELAKLASAPVKQVTVLLDELKVDYASRGMHLDEVAGGWVFRTSPQYAPFVRDLTKQKPVRLTRAQVETLAIIAYRQPITRPEVDDVRGVDSGPVVKLLLERDLVRILGKRDEPGRPLIYGTTGNFLEFFGLKSLKDLPTLREFTELSDESREAFEDELSEIPENAEATAPEQDATGAAVEEQGLAEVDRELEELAALEHDGAEESENENGDENESDADREDAAETVVKDEDIDALLGDDDVPPSDDADDDDDDADDDDADDGDE
jgi:segregation and condensation protein B